ncbi:OmpA family protein [Sphingopyxis yananensis]|uniref:OmpA family protein n=1 Tax=Sphingopyxis yananensis TaxID=2886687 RepID=UPI001D10F23C|nr:OmpA family protein [Sphingopyxis yananensis]MCC2601250.1 OmpA family protein [Sphingopyxis yananensis]
MSSRGAKWTVGFAAVLAAVVPHVASAQALNVNQSVSALRGEVKQRYDAALAMSTNPSVIAANNAVHNWASDAKIQCGIALGFLKSGTKDADSLRRCDFAYGMMNNVPPPASPPAAIPAPPPPPPTDNCPPEVAATFFFDFDSVVPSSDAQASAAFMAENRARCGWRNFTVVGHTDRAGSDAYNNKLSVRRGEAVAAIMTSAGIPANIIAVSGKGESDLRVQTIDGERTPANRRVEVRVNVTGE